MPMDLDKDPLLASLRRRHKDAMVLGGVLLRRKIGEGATGSIYAGLHTRLNIPVAVKILKEASGPGLASLMTEARLTVSIEHPNLVRVYDVNSDFATGLHYIVMEYIEGYSAYELLDKSQKATGRPLSQISAVEIVLSAAKAMAVAHAQGIVHRDLKSDNILVRRDGTVKVTDLGLAGLLKLTPGPSRETSVAGTLGFMSPEVMGGAPATPASDVYGLGATLYELVTGTVPHGPLDGTYRASYFETEASDPRCYTPELDPRVAEVIMRCLKVKAAERFADCSRLVAALEEVMAGLVPSTEREKDAAKPGVDAPVVLVVDDDSEVLEVMREVLANNGFQPVCLNEPHQALALLPQIQPEVAVVDLQMPQMDGILLCRALREVAGYQDLPVLMLSGNGAQTAVCAATKGGIDDYLVKPAPIHELLVRVRLLAKLRQTNRQRQHLETELLKIRKSTGILAGVR